MNSREFTITHIQLSSEFTITHMQLSTFTIASMARGNATARSRKGDLRPPEEWDAAAENDHNGTVLH